MVRPAVSPARTRRVVRFDRLETRDLTLSGDEVHVYTVKLAAGEFLPLFVDQKGADVAAVVVGPSGNTFKVDGLNGDEGLEYLPLLGDPPGLYKIQIFSGEPGAYRLAPEARRGATAKDRSAAVGAAAESLGRELYKGDSPSPERSEIALRKAVEAWKQSGYMPGRANACFRLAEVQHRLGRWEEAHRSFLCSWQGFRDLGESRLESVALNRLGQVEERRGTSESALDFYARSLRVAEDGACEDESVFARLNRGLLLERIGEWSLALQDFEQGLLLASRRGKRDQEIELHNALGKTYLALSSLDAALAQHKKAIELLRESGNDLLLASTLEHRGDVYRRKGDLDRALTNYQTALKIRKRLGDARKEATTLNNMGVIYFSARRLQEARDSFRRAAEIYQGLEDIEQAAVATINTGWSLALIGRYEEAMKAFGKGRTVVREKGLRPKEAVALLGMAWTEKTRGDLKAAERYLKEAMEIIEALRTKADLEELRGSFMAGRHSAYDFLVEVLMERHRREPAVGFDLKALEASERARSRILLDSLEGQASRPRISSLEDLQSLLDEDTVLLEYFLGENKSWVWMVTPETFSAIELEPRSKIEPLAREVHALMARSNEVENREEYILKATELSRLLFGPVIGRFRGRRILVVAPPELQYISFAALPDPTIPETRASRPWPDTLLKRFQIVAEPSASVLATLRRRHLGRAPAPKPLIVVADPAYAAGRATPAPLFHPLQFSDNEARAVQAAAGGKALLVTDRGATREFVMNGGLQGYRSIHISTHGHLVRDSPGKSALVLSPVGPAGKSARQFLQANDIAGLDLQCDLVVLSACSTGLGKEIRGEGLVGLSQAFFSAGASSLVVSLWDVDDLATSELMGLFYSNLLKKNMPAPEALRQAQLSMQASARWKAPARWAGFVLQGEWRKQVPKTLLDTP
jgi:CHAT domain-containing protein/Tfp pilus assembly protein PilF